MQQGEGYTGSIGGEDLVLDTARLGIEAEAFLSSNLGRYMMERAALHREQYLELLYRSAPSDTKENILHRIEISAATKFLEWLNEAINSGKTAHMQIINQEVENDV